MPGTDPEESADQQEVACCWGLICANTCLLEGDILKAPLAALCGYYSSAPGDDAGNPRIIAAAFSSGLDGTNAREA